MMISGLLRKTGFPHSLEVIRVNYCLFSAIYKMPHSKFRERPVFDNNEGPLKCTCGQVLGYKSKREEKIKLRLHYKNCPNPPEGFETINPINPGLLGVELTLGGGVFHPPSITPLSLKLDYSNFELLSDRINNLR